ncbi:MAG: DUF4238 domain-containing protein [Malacoplasma sp.]|nr:DUF4238 domain-containing protein [Malacoplasma sp.]
MNEEKNKKKRQHLIPKLLIKYFLHNKKEQLYYYQRFNSKELKIGSTKYRSKYEDVAQKEYYYENKNFETNEIENKLSEIENYIGKVFSKITKSFENKCEKIKLSWSENYILRLFVSLHGIRTDSVKINALNQTGDFVFNQRYKNLGEDDLKFLQLKKIDFLFEVFNLIKENNPEKFGTFSYEIWGNSDYLNLIRKENFTLEDNLNFFKIDTMLFILQRQTVIFFNTGKNNFILSDSSLITLSDLNSNIILYYYFIIHPKIIIFWRWRPDFKSFIDVYGVLWNGVEKNIPQLYKDFIIEKIDDKGRSLTFYHPYYIYYHFYKYGPFETFYIHEPFYFDFDNNYEYFGKIYDYSICDILNAMSVQHSKFYSFFIDKNDIKKVNKIIESGIVIRIEDINEIKSMFQYIWYEYLNYYFNNEIKK